MASAWAVIDEHGNVNVRSVSQTRRAATVNWLCTDCRMVATVWTSDDEIEGEWQRLAKERRVRVGAVSVVLSN